MNRTRWIVAIAAGLSLVAAVLTYGKKSESNAAGKPVVHRKPVASKVASGKLVKLSTGLSHERLLVGSDGRVFLDVTLDVDQPPNAVRPRVTAALVIDRSGSMSGVKIEHAKQAASRFIDQLKDGDRVAVITYSSDVTLLAPVMTLDGNTRADLRARISEIRDDGGTNIGAGLNAGREELVRVMDGEGVNRIILISDGQATEGLGVTDPKELTLLARDSASAGAPVSAIGVGLEFNENLMRGIAEHGTGQYHYVKDTEALAGIFEEELRSLSQTVAKRAQVSLRLADGVELDRIYGYPYTTEGKTVLIPMADLHGGQSRKLIARFRVPSGAEGTRPVVDVTFRYDDAISNTAAQPLQAKLEVGLTKDADAVAAGRNKTVLAKAETVENALALDEAMAAYERGDVMQAQTVLDGRVNASRLANKDLGSAELEQFNMRLQGASGGMGAAAPTSAAGNDLRKSSKADAFQMAK